MAASAARVESRFEAAQRQYARRIRAFARRNFTSLPGTDPKDLEQELLEVLWLAATSYDPNHGATFNTYFWTNAERRFLDLHKTASRMKRVGDYSRVWLEDEAVARAVADLFLDASAEDEVLARMRVREVFRSGKRPR